MNLSRQQFLECNWGEFVLELNLIHNTCARTKLLLPLPGDKKPFCLFDRAVNFASVLRFLEGLLTKQTLPRSRTGAIYKIVMWNWKRSVKVM